VFEEGLTCESEFHLVADGLPCLFLLPKRKQFSLLNPSLSSFSSGHRDGQSGSNCSREGSAPATPGQTGAPEKHIQVSFILFVFDICLELMTMMDSCGSRFILIEFVRQFV